MPTRHNTNFVKTSGAKYLTSEPGVGFAQGSSQWNTFDAALQTIVQHAAASAALLGAAAANNAGMLPYAALVPLNEAASDLGYIFDRMEAVKFHLQAPAMSSWAKHAAASRVTVDASLEMARAAAETLAKDNPTFDIAQLR